MQTNPKAIKTYPAAMVNITNRCTLRCRHCFVFRDGNPNDPAGEMDDDTMLAKLAQIQSERSIEHMLWMGGEPLLRPEVLQRGSRLFKTNTVTTNGTLDLIELPDCIYVISLDGPPEYNNAIRGRGSFAKVMRTLERIPDGFGPTVMVQCVATAANEHLLEELVELVKPTKAQGMTFSFYVPTADDTSELTWGSAKRRDKAVQKVMELKQKHRGFIWNSRRSLELTLSDKCKAVTDNCPASAYVFPLYLEGRDFVQPFCCYGNDVDCDLCGAWVVFAVGARLEALGLADFG